MKFFTTLFLLLAGSYLLPLCADSNPVFSNERGKFLEELRSLFEATEDKAQLELYENFAQLVDGNTFSDPELSYIIGTCNHMSTRKLRVAPYFTAYLDNLLVIKTTDIGQCNFENWHGAIEAIFNDWKAADAKKLNTYYNFSKRFFKEGILRYSESGYVWSSTERSPTMSFQDGQPTIQFHETTLRAARKGQELFISATKGIYRPLVNSWEGEGGTVSWTRLDPKHDAVATLTSYKIDMKRGEYEGKATLSYPTLLGSRVVAGTVKDKIAGSATKRNNTNPRFYCTGEMVTLTGMGEGLEYRGGFAIEGNTMHGIAPEGGSCSITKTGPSGPVFTLYGQQLSLKSEDLMTAKGVAATIFFGQDSVYHPGINARLEVAAGKLTLKSGDNVLSKSPYYDSRRKVYVYADEISYDANSGKMEMNGNAQGAAADRTVRIESEEYYDENLSMRIRNVADYHPILKIYRLAKREGNVLPAEMVAQDINPAWNEKNIQTLLFDLTKNGFVQYLPKRSLVRILPKTMHYAAVHAEKKDFDNFKIISAPEGSNGEWDLNGDDGMSVRGVKRLEINKKQRVAFMPNEGDLVLGDNRDLSFDGRIMAGYSMFTGEGYDFNYEPYTLDAQKVRYLDFYLPNGKLDKNGRPVAHAIGSRIEHASGTLNVDAPNNKSGREDLPGFPSFRSREKSFVYYDLDNKLGDVYPRESFYFELDPFVMESLSRLTPKSFQFKGRLESAGIFPTIEETLRLQPEDHSLGIRTTTSATGLANYGDRATYVGDILLTNSGLHGNGTLDYLSAKIISEEFVWTPEDMKASAQTFDLDRNAAEKLPRVHGEEVSIHWLPYVDSMFVRSKEQSFDIFTESEHQMKGLLVYTPEGLMGNGVLDWTEGSMDSRIFDFKELSVSSDTANLQIKTLQQDGVAFETDNLHGTMDFDRQFGKFKANRADAITRMPHNRYETSLNDFEWNLGKRNLTFVAPPGELGSFLATDKSADSLFFEGATAQYDFNTSELHIGGVPEIRTADALIRPADGAVVVAAGGRMHQFDGATILAADKHEFRNATVNISGRNEYTGSGQYNHAVGDLEQWIDFGSLEGRLIGKRGSKVPTTIGQAQIPAEREFFCGEGFLFNGEVELNSGLNDLHYDGFAKLAAPQLPGVTEFSVDFAGDRNELLVRTEKPKDREGNPLVTGIFLRTDNRQILPRLLQIPNERKDENLFEVGGDVRYDATTQTYRFADSLRIAQDFGPGNLLSYHAPTNVMKATGSFRVGHRMKGPQLQLIGNMEMPAAAAGTTVNPTGNFAAGLNLGLPRELQRFIQLDFLQYKLQALGSEYKDIELYTTVLHTLVSKPKKNLAPVLQNLRIGNQFVLPNEDQQFDFLLTHLEMRYDENFQSFMSQHGKLGLAYMGKEDYHKTLKATLELKQTADGDQFYLLLESPSGNYFYFAFKDDLLLTYSNNDDYNSAVDKLKSNERSIKTDTGNYTIELGEPQLLQQFRGRMATHGVTD